MSMIADLLPKVGLDFETVDVNVYLRGPTSVATSTVIKGNLLAFCVADAAVEITNSSTYDALLSTATATPGARNSIWANVTLNYTSTHVGSQIYGIALENMTVGTASNPRPLMKVRVRGLVKATVESSDNTTSIAVGSSLFMSNSKGGGNMPGYLDGSLSRTPTSTATRRKLAIALEAYNGTSAGTSGGTVMQVLFDGLNGFSAANQT